MDDFDSEDTQDEEPQKAKGTSTKARNRAPTGPRKQSRTNRAPMAQTGRERGDPVPCGQIRE